MQPQAHQLPLEPQGLPRRNPLTGLCGLQRYGDNGPHFPCTGWSQSPYGAMRFATERPTPLGGVACGAPSQSPYGAMRFATVRGQRPPLPLHRVVAIPLRGYAVCNLLEEGEAEEVAWEPVAIPLRGYAVCNSTPLRTPFWTAPPEGVFVRKMKLGICIGQRVGVLRGLGRWEDFGRGVKWECIGEYCRPRGKKLAFKVPSRMPGTGTL